MDDELRSRLIHRRNLLKKIIEEKENTEDAYPKGRLRISQSHGRTQYFSRIDPKDWVGSYIRKDNQELAYKLAQKDYDLKVLKVAKNELKTLEALIKQLKENTVESIYERLSEPRKKLVTPAVLTDEQYVNRWEKKEYVKKGFYKDTPEYYTAKGERVRSKSEIIIADSLNRRNIPYLYEYPLVLEGTGTIHPNFTVLNVRLRKEYFWEHLGMMDDVHYVGSSLERIMKYEKHGFFPGERLIITHETSTRPLQTRIIDEMITHYLL